MHPEPACLDADDVAAFLHRRLRPTRVHSLDQHVAVCAECRELLSALAESEAPAARAMPHGDAKSSAAMPRSAGSRVLPGAWRPLDAAPPSPAQGRTIGAYRLLGKLGEGGMGTVHLAEHALLGRRAAIKVVRSSLSEDAEIVERFFHEARVVSQIADPGIVQVFDFGHDTDGSAFIVMELLEGEALDQRIARVDRFGVFEGLRLIRMICNSLGAVHARGIVHRDLKPANIFLVEDPAVPGRERAKLLDFGIAKLARDDAAARATRTASAIGTPAYMSPEQCRGSDIVDQRSDIYSIGCVLFAMLTGEPPFETTAPGDLFAAHLSQTPPLASSRVPEVPPAVDQILASCLAKSADDRFASTSELVLAIDLAEQALLRAAASVTPLPSTMPAAAITPAPLSSTEPPASLLIRRPPRVVVIPALAALAVAAAAVVGSLLGGGAIREESQSAGAASSASAAASISSAGAASSSMSGTATPASSGPSAASIRSGGATASSTPHAAIPAPNDVPTIAPDPPSAPGEPSRKRAPLRPGRSSAGRKPLHVDRSD